jgi:hypothetical protein
MNHIRLSFRFKKSCINVVLGFPLRNGASFAYSEFL